MNGSSRAPKRDLVRRTPFATALTLPCWRVRSVTMRSASPSFWARRTIAASRYRAMGAIVLCRTSSVGMTCRSPAADRLRTTTLDATALDYLDHLARDSAPAEVEAVDAGDRPGDRDGVASPRTRRRRFGCGPRTLTAPGF